MSLENLEAGWFVSRDPNFTDRIFSNVKELHDPLATQSRGVAAHDNSSRKRIACDGDGGRKIDVILDHDCEAPDRSVVREVSEGGDALRGSVPGDKQLEHGQNTKKS